MVAVMGLFDKKTPMEKWRRRSPLSARFADHSGWEVDLGTGVVHTTVSDVPVTAMIDRSHTSVATAGVIVEAGEQARRTLRNEIGDDGGDEFERDGWRGRAASGSGVVERTTKDRVDDVFYDDVVAAAHDLVRRIT